MKRIAFAACVLLLVSVPGIAEPKGAGKAKPKASEFVTMDECRAEVERLAAKVREKDREIAKLEKKIRALRRDLRNETDSLEGYRMQAKDLEHRAEVAEERVEKLSKQLYGINLDCSVAAHGERVSLINKLRETVFHKIELDAKGGPGVWVKDVFYDMSVDDKATALSPVMIECLCLHHTMTTLAVYDWQNGNRIATFSLTRGLEMN